MGGAQAIAALAYGTATVAPVDVIVGPGQLLRAGGQAPGRRDWSGIDGIAGPSELLVIADARRRPARGRARPRRPGRARAGQPRGGRSARAPTLLDAVEREAAAHRGGASRRCRTRRSRSCAPTTSRRRSTSRTRSRPSTSSWPARTPSGSAERVRASGCVFVGGAGGAAFGDYAAGSNHVLPTGGAARFSGPLGRRRFSAQTGAGIVARGGGAGARAARRSVARAEGFPVHAESAEATGRHARRQPQGHLMAITTPPRAAEIERSTRRRSIRLRLALDGVGRVLGRRPASASSTTCSTCSRATRGSTSTSRRPATSRPARTTRPRTSASCSGRRSTRRSATAAASPATATRPCRWTRRSPRARSTLSGRPFCAFEGTIPAATIGGFETELTEEFFRAVANNAKLTVHVRAARRHERPPHDRGVLQVVRARAARGDVAGRLRRAGVPSTKGVL